MPFFQISDVLHCSGRMLTDSDFSNAWKLQRKRPHVYGGAEFNNVCVVSCSSTEVRVLFDKIPTDEASCPKSKSSEAMAGLYTQIGLGPGPQFPYPVDFKERFFIPASAIVCTLENGKVLECEGMLDVENNTIRVDAVDQEEYAWFYVSARYEDKVVAVKAE